MASIISLQKKFQSSLESSDFYTAEQTCRTIAHRLRNSAGSSGSSSSTAATLEEARKVISEGSIALLQRKEIQSGTALGLDLLRDLKTDGISFTDAKEEIFRVINAFGEAPIGKEKEKERIRFLQASIDFSRKAAGGKLFGDEILNAMAAEACWRIRDYPKAQKLFLRSNAPQRFGAMLLQWSCPDDHPENGGVSSEVELFLMRAVLSYTTNANLADAHVVLDIFVSKYGQGFSPLANFCTMLLEVLERRDAYPLFQKLRDAYGSSLQRDPSFAKSMDMLAEMFFGVRPALTSNNMLQGMMSDMMKSFLSGGRGGGGAGGGSAGGMNSSATASTS